MDKLLFYLLRYLFRKSPVLDDEVRLRRSRYTIPFYSLPCVKFQSHDFQPDRNKCFLLPDSNLGYDNTTVDLSVRFLTIQFSQ